MRYEIRVDGDTAETTTLHEAFPELELTLQDTHTVLCGPVDDEDHLYGLLVRLQELGLQVSEFRQLPA